MGDRFTVEYAPASGPRRRNRYEPRSDGPGYWRIAEEWNGCTWRIIGREPVTDVVCSTETEILIE